jgi:hypothetical protein
MLARVHEHCGCASITSVGLSGARDSLLTAGHCFGACALTPGVLSYRQSTHNPAAAPPNHNAASIQSQTGDLNLFERLVKTRKTIDRL